LFIQKPHYIRTSAGGTPIAFRSLFLLCWNGSARRRIPVVVDFRALWRGPRRAFGSIIKEVAQDFEGKGNSLLTAG